MSELNYNASCWTLGDALKELKSKDKEIERLKADLQAIYEPVCRICFITENELKRNSFTKIGKEFIIEGVEEIIEHAKKSEWFISKKKGQDDE